jgi:small nuclear ribonucleoprotein (snRNP)-like protein
MFSWKRTAVRRRVMVNTKTDKTFRAVLWAKRGSLLILKDAFLLQEGIDQPVKVDGEVVVERGNVDFIQILPEV